MYFIIMVSVGYLYIAFKEIECDFLNASNLNHTKHVC